MAVRLTHDTGAIFGCKVIGDTLVEINTKIGFAGDGDLAWVDAVAGSDGGLYIKVGPKATSFTKICEVGSEVTP
jgi:hypothetical protein